MKTASVRLRLNPVQLCHIQDIVVALGGAISARASHASYLQKLVEHFIAISLHQGLITPVTLEEAHERLAREILDFDTTKLDLISVNSLPGVKPEVTQALEKKKEIEEALIKQQSEENAELGDLFK